MDPSLSLSPLSPTLSPLSRLSSPLSCLLSLLSSLSLLLRVGRRGRSPRARSVDWYRCTLWNSVLVGRLGKDLGTTCLWVFEEFTNNKIQLCKSVLSDKSLFLDLVLYSVVRSRKYFIYTNWTKRDQDKPSSLSVQNRCRQLSGQLLVYTFSTPKGQKVVVLYPVVPVNTQ